MIYFLQEGPEGPIKIGHTGNIKRRISTLRTGNSRNLVLLGIMEGDRRLEKNLHGIFRKKQGEWFEPSPSLYEYIRMNCDEALRPTS